MYLLSRPTERAYLAGMFERALAPLRSLSKPEQSIDLFPELRSGNEEHVTPRRRDAQLFEPQETNTSFGCVWDSEFGPRNS